MEYKLEQVKEAYIKLKSYVYYDNTDLLLRRSLVEFESNRPKEDFLSNMFGSPKGYKGLKNLEINSFSDFVDAKLARITEGLNSYNDKPEFFDFFLQKIKVDFYPKSFEKEDKVEDNFITNKRVSDKSYKVDRVTAFINAPIEIHIISVLWIINYGVAYDLELDDNSLGNRLLINKNKERIIQGSSLFKPYFKQYQKWRDDSVETAQRILAKNKNVLFLNLDIRDYFHSVRIPAHELGSNGSLNNLKDIFLKIHKIYTKQLAEKYCIPYKFIDEVQVNNSINEVILPIGLLSSYVLANHYLKKFDSSILQKIKPAYYGRYVDDILIVLEAPQDGFKEDDIIDELKFDFQKYKNEVESKSNYKLKFEASDLTKLEEFVLTNIYPLIKLVDTPPELKTNKDNTKIEKIFKIEGYKSLYCQSEKSLAYYFDHEESDLVIGKLKKELDERSSEFRDFPDESENDNSFEESAYHLLYDGSEGKIRTLKDYKENRFGLTVYLANKIFSALRHDKRITEKEKDQVLKFFKGINCLSFYRLWERIFTFFLVNRQAEAYVEFYLHCVNEIDKLKESNKAKTSNTMLEYLDIAHETALSLNPSFIEDTKKAATHFDFNLNRLERYNSVAFSYFVPTTKDSYWLNRFRLTNMMRHHYVIHPLLNYTVDSKKSLINLVDLKVQIKDYKLDDELIANSPRPIKFSECCLAIAFLEMSGFENSTSLKPINDE
ncbi:RNA-directed DNA polymerase [Pelobium sp.]|nr:RNA-directed DNA polymerase [Pelobium sp.]MDA9554844.1 RNA-directed DNA polymerase [Pelobium sp.]